MVSGYPKPIGILQVDGLSMGPLEIGASHNLLLLLCGLT